MILAILIILGVVFQTPAMIRTGALGSSGIPYFGPLARDGVWHEALVNQLKLGIPPENPGFAGQALTNYHYFYDLVVAGLSLFAKVSASALIYQFLPIVFSLLLGAGTYYLAKRLFNSKKAGIYAVFFAYFASSFGWIVSIIKKEELAGESTFWANQPVSMNLNPPYAASLILLIFGTLVLDSYIKKPKILSGLVLAVLFGLLIGFKAYAGAIVLAALFLLTLKKVFLDKSFYLVPPFLVSLAIFLTIYMGIGKNAAGLIAFQPLWLVDSMIDAGDRVGIVGLTMKRFAFLGGGKWLNYALIEIISLAIFFIGNLGTRVIGLWGLRKKFIKDDLHLFIFFLTFAALLPPLIFVQKGNPWNIVQFFYYFMFFAGLYAANAMTRFPKTLVIALILITPISSLATFRSWLYPNPPAYLPASEYQALEFLKIQPQGAVLKFPFSQSMRGKYKDPYPLSVYADNAYVSAKSSHPVFIEDAEQQIILDTDYQARLDAANRFFVEKDLSWSKDFLMEGNISYVYLPKIYSLPMAEKEYPMRKIYENDSVNIYQVNK